MAKIKTEKGIYYFTPKPLFAGRKKIDKFIAKQNLLDFNTIAKQNQLQFGLIYGTLLGAIRENDFIEHDEDIDLFVLAESRDLLLNVLFELKENGFDVVRYDRRGLVSIIRNNEYIDIYIFEKFKKGVRICCGECVLEKFIKETTSIEFLSEYFTVPKDYFEYLNFEYGSDWKVPIPYTDFDVRKGVKILVHVKERVKLLLPNFLFLIFMRYKERRSIRKFYTKIRLIGIDM